MIERIAIALLGSILVTSAASPLTFDEKQLEPKGSGKVGFIAGGNNQISLRFDDPGGDSGVRLLPPAGRRYWDLSGGNILAVDVENRSRDQQLRLTLHVSSGTWNENDFSEITSGIALNPGEKRTMNLPIRHRRIHSPPAGVPGPKVMDSDKVNPIGFHMQWPFEGKRPGLVDCRISNLRLTGTPDSAGTVHANRFFPFIDDYGQYVHADWPEKIHSDTDLKMAHAKELAELAASKRPQEWNRYGGWSNGPKLEATGHFRTAKHQGKWYFVDPEGRLFFSHGIDVLRAHTDATQSRNHENWFAFPVTTGELPFAHWNLRKKYGKEEYELEYYATLSKRLEHWGMNSIGNWGKSDLIEQGRTPYTLQLSDYNPALPRIAGSKLKFYDVFDPAYINAMKHLVSSASRKNPEIAKSLTDPMCIGYFIDNELNFGNRGRQMLGDDVLKSPTKQACKQEFVNDLKARHLTIEKLNSAWETDYPDWNALLTRSDVPKSKGYKSDSDVFFLKSVDQYFRLCHDAVKSAAPHRLYLGCRLIGTDATRKVLFDASKKYCDVLSTNVYAHSVANLGCEGFPDMPVLIGEFHFGVLDRGMFSPGLVGAGVTQRERALAYTRFMQGALVHPGIVGAHWFQFRDQPLTGRWDGEGYAIGFVDVADTPYPELIRATRRIGETMYHYRLGKQ